MISENTLNEKDKNELKKLKKSDKSYILCIEQKKSPKKYTTI